MTDQQKKHLELIKTALDKGVQAGVYSNLETAYSISVAFNDIYNALIQKKLEIIHGGEDSE